MATPQTLEELYQQVLNRPPDVAGQQYWQQQFGDTIDPNEVQTFTAAAQPELGQQPPPLFGGFAAAPVNAPVAAPAAPVAAPVAAPAVPQYGNIEELYQGILGRAPDQPGMEYWQKQFGETLDPDEIKTFQQAAAPEQNITKLYQDILGRAPDQPGLEYWQKQFGETIDPNEIKTFTAAAMPEMSPELVKLYQDVLGRAPDVEGFQNWRKQFGETIDEEEAAKFRADAAPELAISQQYKDLYKNVLGREADVEGLGFWMKEFGSEIDPYELNRFKTIASSEIFNKNQTIEGLSNLLKTPDIGYGAVKNAYSTLAAKQDLTEDERKQLDSVGQKLTNLEKTWGGYGVDPLQTETLYQQITGINKALNNKNWQGSWMSGGDNAAKEAAVRLQKLGVDNLADLKVEQKYAKNTAVEMYQGQTVQTDDKGKFIGGGVDEVGREMSKTYLPAGAQTQLFSVNEYQDAGEGGGSYVDYKPLTEAERKSYDPKTGQYDFAAGKQLIDASTGKVIGTNGSGFLGGGGGTDNNFVIDYYDTGNFFKGKDKTFGIRIAEDGTPVPYITTEKTGLVTTPILPILLGMLAPGIGNFISSGISSALPGAAVTGGAGAAGAAAGIGYIPATALNTTLSSALSGGIMSGLSAELMGGDFGKGFLGGVINPLASAGIGSLLPSGLDPAIANMIKGGAGSVLTTAIQGGDVGEAIKGALTSSAIGYGTSQVVGGLNLTPEQARIATQIATPIVNSLVQSGQVSDQLIANVLLNAAVDAAKNTKPATPSTNTDVVSKLQEGGLIESYPEYGFFESAYEPVPEPDVVLPPVTITAKREEPEEPEEPVSLPPVTVVGKREEEPAAKPPAAPPPAPSISPPNLAQLLTTLQQIDPWYADIELADLEEMFSGKAPIVRPRKKKEVENG